MEKPIIIEEIIFPAIDSVNRLVSDENKIEQNLQSQLNTYSGNLDSLTFINLVVELEKNIKQKLGKPIALTDEEVISATPNPFATVSTLADKIEQLAGA